MLRIGFIKIASAPVLLSLVLPLCAADKFPDYPVRLASEYPTTAEQSGLIIGVQPVEDLKDQTRFLGMGLSPVGYLPVFIVLQNNSGDSFLFDKTKLTFGQGDSPGASPTTQSRAGEGVSLAGALLVAPVAIFVGAKLIADASKVQQNILKKAVQSKTLFPGTSVHGFLYIPAPKKGQREKIHLQVPVTRVGTAETVVLSLIF